MSNRTAKFVSAVFASIVASAPLTTVSHGAAPAADECLSGPKGQTPSGGHWYYRIDRATKRHCWYVRDEKLSRAAPKDSAPSTDSVSPQQEAATQQSIADAHAELPLAQTRVEQQTNATIWPPNPATAANAASIENGRGANAQDGNRQRSVVATRWPEQSGVISSASPEPTTLNSNTTEPSNSEAAPPAVAAVPRAAADSSSEKKSGSVQTLLVVIIGALALAGLIGSFIFKFGRTPARRQIRRDRRAIWDAVDTDRPSPPVYPRADMPTRTVDIPLKPRETGDPNDRIAEMLARLARSAAT